MLRIYIYACMHINGEEKLWVDMISLYVPTQTIRIIINIPHQSSTESEDFELPTPSKIRKAVDDNRNEIPTEFI